jgi:ABC-type dipeptide/oligopeptide/nickel transport system permease component
LLSVVGWARLIGRRLLLLPAILLLVLTLTFVLTRVVGGNPAIKLAGPQPTKEAVASIERELGLNKSLLAQYGDYVGGLFQGDLGKSYFTKQSVFTEVTSRAPATIELVIFGSLIALVLGLSLGVLAALRRGKVADRVTQGLSILAFATPDFWLGLVLSFVFFYKLRWFPAPIGQLPVEVSPPDRRTGFLVIDSILAGDGLALEATFRHLALPALTLGLIYFAPIYKVTRASMIETLGSDFLLYAEACGLRRRLEWRYAVRRSLTLVVTYLGIIVAALIGGSVLVERVYAWGGLGSYGVDAIVNNDFPAVQGFVVAVGVIAILVYLLVDVLYAVIDPRVRLT